MVYVPLHKKRFIEQEENKEHPTLSKLKVFGNAAEYSMNMIGVVLLRGEETMGAGEAFPADVI